MRNHIKVKHNRKNVKNHHSKIQGCAKVFVYLQIHFSIILRGFLMTSPSRIFYSFSLLLFSSFSLSAQSDEMQKQQQEILDLINLPKATAKARTAGYKDADVKDIINLQKENKISSAETVDLLNEATISAKDGDKVDNFGLNVKRSVEEGKNGRELSTEIRTKNEERKALRAEKEKTLREENERKRAEINRANKAKAKSKASVSKSKKGKKNSKAVTKSKKSKSKAVKAKKSSKKSTAKKSTAKKSSTKKKGKSKK